MAEEKRDFERFAGDIATIKSILMAADERFFTNPGFSILWGIYPGRGMRPAFSVAHSATSLSTIFFNMWIRFDIHNFT